jgi:hypothetical protein
MKVLFDIGHPAHVHFFKHPILQLAEKGHDICVTSRDKEVAHQLLDGLGIRHISLTAQSDGSVTALLRELLVRDYRLYRQVRRFKPDIMAAIGGIFIAHAGLLARVPSLVFYDTENARLQNALTYPFASRVIVPRCYATWVPRKKCLRYAGYHELSYLHPGYFTPDRDIALRSGLSPDGATYLVRLVSWKASHDLDENGWDHALLYDVVTQLGQSGKVIISSEKELPEVFKAYLYRGDPADLHHVMAFCRGYIGESATMASECAVLGVPAVYAAETGRGYTDEQEQKYGLVCNIRHLDKASLQHAVNWILDYAPDRAIAARRQLLAGTIDVARMVGRLIEAYPDQPGDMLMPEGA